MPILKFFARISRYIIPIVLVLFLFQSLFAGGKHPRGSYRQHKSTYSSGVKHDSHGKIKRSSSAKTAFKKQTGYPHGRKGYVIDHVVPLSRGGSDSPSNMQWQTKEAAKAKDKWERGQSSTKTKHTKTKHTKGHH